jgi:hypothetical protein
MYQGYASSMCQHHKDIPQTIYQRYAITSPRHVSMLYKRYASTITSPRSRHTLCIHVPTRPPKHASSMCHTIYDTSLKPNENIHFYHVEDLMHIITDQHTNLVHIIFNKHKITSSLNFTSASLGQSQSSS